MVGGEEAQQLFNLGRYHDPQGRFSLIVPGGWFPAESDDPNQALFLSQNKQNDPIAWFVVHVYKAHLTPKFTAVDTVNQLRDMLLKEGASHGALEMPMEDGAATEMAKDVAVGTLGLGYQSPEGKQIAQLHILTVDGQYAFNIQVTVEDSGDLAEMAAYLIEIASNSLWTKNLCEAGVKL